MFVFMVVIVFMPTSAKVSVLVAMLVFESILELGPCCDRDCDREC